jgi:putative glutamine amidotransferase
MHRLKNTAAPLAFILLAAFLAAPGFLQAQAPPPRAAQENERFFDTASAPAAMVRLTVFYPSVNSLRHILALKEQGFIPFDNLEIVGVYHVKERTNYRDSVRFVRDNNLPNIHFHGISADLGIPNIFKKNAASDEFRKIFDLSDGIIFFGGPDMPPAAYGEKMDFRTEVTDPFRHYVELSMIFHLLGGRQDESVKAFLADRPDFPVLGICLGMQSLNVGTGGTMIQDLWSEIYGVETAEDAIALGQQKWHRNPYSMLAPLERTLGPYMLHQVKLAPEGRAWKAIGMTAADRPYIASSHHQAVDKLGLGFRPVAFSLDDKIVEAIEHEKYPNVLGVQFHPEYRKLWDATPEFKYAPDDPDLFGYRTLLEANPPSFEFHKKLWNWFFTKVKGTA